MAHPPPSSHAPHRHRAVAVPRPELLVCPECDALYGRPVLQAGHEARCARCGYVLGRGHRLGLPDSVALALASLVCFAIANLEPVVTLDLRGRHSVATLPVALVETWLAGEPLIAVLAAAVAFAFPFAVVVLRLYVLQPTLTGRLPPGWTVAMHALHFCGRWSMVEVLMLAALVAIVRIASLATVIAGPGLYAFAALAVLLTALQSTGERRLWHLAGSGKAFR